MELNTVEDIISDIRQGRMVVLLDDDAERSNEGVVMMAAEHVTAEHVNFMARKARGLVCLTLTEERCRQLDLPPMVEQANGEKSSFTLSIEAAEGVETGISAADRARTVLAAVAPHAQPADIVQPGHIFPLTVVPGGVLMRAGHTEAASDYVRLAGLSPFAMMADILTPEGTLADAAALTAFAREHDLKIGSIADLIHFRTSHERTIRRVREGTVTTRYGEFRLVAYRDQTAGDLHLALSLGEIRSDQPTLVRVHIASAMRDLVCSRAPARPSWDIGSCLQAVADAGAGVVVLLARQESPDQLLASVDLALGLEDAGRRLLVTDAYHAVGLGSQILRDLGVGQIRLMGAPIKYNAISGFGLEVMDFVDPRD
jgi:3,4-dihydroxy 2-butanone 4-phosphate synthase/GTP cyclohydrolase II